MTESHTSCIQAEAEFKLLLAIELYTNTTLSWVLVIIGNNLSGSAFCTLFTNFHKFSVGSLFIMEYEGGVGSIFVDNSSVFSVFNSIADVKNTILQQTTQTFVAWYVSRLFALALKNDVIYRLRWVITLGPASGRDGRNGGRTNKKEGLKLHNEISGCRNF